MIQNNDIVLLQEMRLRILEKDLDGKCLVIDCNKLSMPFIAEVPDDAPVIQFAVYQKRLTPNEQKKAQERFNVISPLLPYMHPGKGRSKRIKKIADKLGVTPQTVRRHICTYLAYQSVSYLADKQKKAKRLSADELNYRWALNKFFYTSRQHTLKTAYALMLKERYCDDIGQLSSTYPSFMQFRYYYRKTKSDKRFYIAREGIKNYQKKHRPLTGGSIREYAGGVGLYMTDSTTCDIYLVDDAGNLAGRPILTATVDAYSGLCVGYALTWEGGIYALRSMMQNIVCDKKDYCERFGISIESDEWPVHSLGGRMMTDMGREFVSDAFSQISELGVQITNIQPYRPDLKGNIERFFHSIQSLYKPHLKGRGVIEPDYQERGAHDYRQDACLSMADFEKIIIRCIIYYNTKRIIKSFHFSKEMMESGIKPYANEIWLWSCKQGYANLIDVSSEILSLILLPRTIGKFSRVGLKVNGMRYAHKNYTQKFLTANSEVKVAYDPEHAESVWLIEESGDYVKFDLIGKENVGMSVSAASVLQSQRKQYLQKFEADNLQAEIGLIAEIETIAKNKRPSSENGIKEIKQTKKRQKVRARLTQMEEQDD